VINIFSLFETVQKQSHLPRH